MVLEATVLVIDNSEWMRNGDYTPTRLEAQADATTFLFNAKTQANPENTVGLMTMSGKGPEVLVTLTSDIGKILTALHHVKILGQAHFTTAVQVAQLALKHRQNKNQRQRIIVFVGSPVHEDEKTLVKLAKKLKKNNVAVDVISFGEEQENQEKLKAFVDNVNSSNNSNLLTIPPGPHILSDVLISSPIVQGEDGSGATFATGGGFEFGVDPNLDPELALALRISLEEERARQEKASGGNASGSGATETKEDNKMEVDAPTSAPVAPGNPDEDEMLAKALALSMGGGGAMELSEEEQIAQAIALSMGGAPSTQAKQEPDLSSVVGSLPGVDKNDPKIKEALKKKEEEDKKKKDGSK